MSMGICHTNGKGLWTRVAKAMTVELIKLIAYRGEDGRQFGEMQAVFYSTSWDVHKDGLIYTDPLWIEEFRNLLVNELGHSKRAALDVDYSEQGMQSDDYVSLDCGSIFMSESMANPTGKISITVVDND